MAAHGADAHAQAVDGDHKAARVGCLDEGRRIEEGANGAHDSRDPRQAIGRDGYCAKWFMDDVASRLATRVQMTSDGHKAYLEAVEGAFGGDIDYAVLHKV